MRSPSSSDRQFDEDEILRAADLLAHAKVNVIAWNGTSASWLGFERDEQLCARILSTTGVAACTSVLAFREIFQRTGVSRVGLVTPYVANVQAKIIDNWRKAGVFCPAERHSGLRDNFAFAEVSEARHRRHGAGGRASGRSTRWRSSARICAAPA